MDPGLLQEKLKCADQSGLFDFPSCHRALLEAAAAHLDFSFFPIDFNEASTLPKIMHRLGKALSFPDDFGFNLDALNDCLTDLSWHKSSGYALLISNAKNLSVDGQDFQMLSEVFSSAIEYWQGQKIPFWIFYENEASYREDCFGFMTYKIPVSVQVVIHTPLLEILLLERKLYPGYWQSVTGSYETGEHLIETAQREVKEETGIFADPNDFIDWKITNVFEILPQWRCHYAPFIRHIQEHIFSLKVPDKQPVCIAPSEHSNYCWLPWQQASDKCFSWSNKESILRLAHRALGELPEIPAN